MHFSVVLYRGYGTGDVSITARTLQNPGIRVIFSDFLGVRFRDAPDTGTVFAGYPTNPKAGYRISGRILGLTTIFLVKYRYQINL
jgi:hypothetical protein